MLLAIISPLKASDSTCQGVGCKVDMPGDEVVLVQIKAETAKHRATDGSGTQCEKLEDEEQCVKEKDGNGDGRCRWYKKAGKKVEKCYEWSEGTQCEKLEDEEKCDKQKDSNGFKECKWYKKEGKKVEKCHKNQK